MIFGNRVRITFNGRTVDAQVLFGSDNRKSLLLVFDCALYTSDGGMYCGNMPVSATDDTLHNYKELRGDPVTLEWL